MAAVTAHQIQEQTLGRQRFTEQLPQRGDSRRIKMHRQAGEPIEEAIIMLIVAREIRGW
jgi:hypothetical protein